MSASVVETGSARIPPAARAEVAAEVAAELVRCAGSKGQKLPALSCLLDRDEIGRRRQGTGCPYNVRTRCRRIERCSTPYFGLGEGKCQSLPFPPWSRSAEPLLRALRAGLPTAALILRYLRRLMKFFHLNFGSSSLCPKRRSPACQKDTHRRQV